MIENEAGELPVLALEVERLEDGNSNKGGLPARACGTVEKATFYTTNAAWLKRFRVATLAAFAAIVNVAMLGVSGRPAAGLLEPDFQPGLATVAACAVDTSTSVPDQTFKRESWT